MGIDQKLPDYCQSCLYVHSEPSRCNGSPEIPMRKGWCSQEKELFNKGEVKTALSHDDHEFIAALEALGVPEMLRSDAIISVLLRNGIGNVKDYGGRLQSALSRQKYSIYRNPERSDGRWKYGKKVATVYVKQGVTPTIEKLLTLM